MAISFFNLISKRSNGKKGIFFSLLSVFILLAFLILFSSLFEPKTFLVKQDLEDELVLLSNSQLTFFKDTYLQNILKISSRIALISYIDDINNNGFTIDCQSAGDGCADDSTELSALNDALIKILVTGRTDGKIIGSKDGRFAESKYENLTLLNQLNEVRKIYRDHFQVELNFLDTSGHAWPVDPETDSFDVDQSFVDENLIDQLKIGQVRPYFMEANLTIGFNYSTKSDSLRWVYDSLNVVAEVPITGLIDPVYLNYTKTMFGDAHQYNNTFKENIIYDFSSSDMFLKLYNTSNYMSAPDHAPSFIQRLVNSNRTSHCCGISSIVNLYEVFGGSIGDAERTVINSLNPVWYKRSSIDTLFFHGIGTYICKETTLDTSKQLYWVDEVERPTDGDSYFTIDAYHANLFNIPAVFYDEDDNPNSLEAVQYCEDSDACLASGTCPN